MMYSLLSFSLILIAALNAQTTVPPQPQTQTSVSPQTTSVVPAQTQTAAVTIAQTEPPQTQTQAPVTPSNPDPVVVTTSNPNQVTPINPPQPQPPVTQVTPQQPPTTPQYGALQPGYQQPGYNPYNPYGQQYNPYGAYGGFMGGMMDPQNLNCEFGQCRNRRITLSPGQGFQLNCQQPFQCDGLDLTLNVGHDPTHWGSGVSEINDLNFDAPQNGVTVRINSVGGNNIEVNNIHCKQMGSCRNLKVIAGWGVELWNINVHCDMPGSCTGCTINGQSCAMISMMNGNNNGYMPYGYGYTNTAIMPGQFGQPQQPGSPQQPQGPQQPQYPQYQQPQFQPIYPGWV